VSDFDRPIFPTSEEAARAWTAKIWADEQLRRSREKVCGSAEECTCHSENLLPDEAARCANASADLEPFSRPTPSPDRSILDNLGDTYHRLTHPLVNIRGWEALGERVRFTYGKLPGDERYERAPPMAQIWIKLW